MLEVRGGAVGDTRRQLEKVKVGEIALEVRRWRRGKENYGEPQPSAQASNLFSLILSALLDGHVRPAMLTGINLVRTEQFVLAKLLKPMGEPPGYPRHRE